MIACESNILREMLLVFKFSDQQGVTFIQKKRPQTLNDPKYSELLQGV